MEPTSLIYHYWLLPLNNSSHYYLQRCLRMIEVPEGHLNS
jgi:hypothetical protein